MSVYSFYTHGTSLAVQDNKWNVQRSGAGTIVTPSTGDLQNWVFFPMPTLLVADSIHPVYINNVSLRFQCGNLARVVGINVWEAEGSIFTLSGLVLGPTSPFNETWTLPANIIPGSGVMIGVEVKFESSGPASDAYAQFIAAGVQYTAG
jgi:hypothetical protein